MVADPKPQIAVTPLDGDGTVVQRDPSRPDFPAIGRSNFLKM
jgi:hypothetical protein